MEKLQIILFDEDKLTQTIIESCLKDLTFDYSLEIYNDFNESIINDIDGMKVIMVNINPSNYNLPEKISGLSKNKKNQFIIISNDKSANLQVRALRAGCRDFLGKPVVKSDLIYSIQTIYNENCCNSDFNGKGRIFTAVSYEKKSGKTFFLINLAKALSEYEKTILIDLNERDNVFSYIKNSSLVRQFDNIKQYKQSSLFIMKSAKFDELELNKLKRNFKYILIDCNLTSSGQYREFLKNIDAIFVITTPNGVIDTDKYKTLPVQNKNINLIVNEYNEKYLNLIEKFQNIMGKEVLLTIPNSVYASKQAEFLGETIIEFNENLDVSKSYKKLAQIISDGK